MARFSAFPADEISWLLSASLAQILWLVILLCRLRARSRLGGSREYPSVYCWVLRLWWGSGINSRSWSPWGLLLSWSRIRPCLSHWPLGVRLFSLHSSYLFQFTCINPGLIYSLLLFTFICRVLTSVAFILFTFWFLFNRSQFIPLFAC